MLNDGSRRDSEPAPELPPEIVDPGYWQSIASDITPLPEDVALTKQAPARVVEFDPAAANSLSAIAWANLDVEPDERLLGDVITTTTRAFLVGSTGLGKTMLAHALAGGMATGKGLLGWTCDRPSRWLILDGEMPTALVKTRAADLLRRAGGNAVPPHSVLIYSRDREEAFAAAFPALGKMPPLNSESGWVFVTNLIDMVGGVDGVIFDNVMSLAPGDQKDESVWAGCVPLVDILTRRRIAQIWCDHTGHNAGRQYGSNTKSWRFDCVAIITPLGEADRPTDHLAFNLSFDSPGKARRRTPDNWNDFAPRVVRLINDEWSSAPAGEGKAFFSSEARLSDTPAVLLREIQTAIAQRGSTQIPEEGMPKCLAVTRSIVRDRLIAAGWFPDHLLRTSGERTELVRAGYTHENHALTTLKRKKLIGFTRELVWLP